MNECKRNAITLNCSSEQIRTRCVVIANGEVGEPFSVLFVVESGTFDVDSSVGILDPCPID